MRPDGRARLRHQSGFDGFFSHIACHWWRDGLSAQVNRYRCGRACIRHAELRV